MYLCFGGTMNNQRSNTDFGPQLVVIGALASAIQSSSTQTVSRTAVDYPATLYPYGTSVASGVAAMTADLKAAVAACPTQKIVLLGYSQGGESSLFLSTSIDKFCSSSTRVVADDIYVAECVGDTLGGGGGAALGTATTTGVDYASLGSHVAAAIMVTCFPSRQDIRIWRRFLIHALTRSA